MANGGGTHIGIKIEVCLGMFACLLVLGEEKPYCSNKNVLKQGWDSVDFFLEVMFVVRRAIGEILRSFWDD